MTAGPDPRLQLSEIAGAVVVFDEAGRISFANEAATRLLAPHGEPVVGRPLGEFVEMLSGGESMPVTERLAAIVESSDDIIVSKTLDGVVTSWNKGAERILGYSAEEMIGRHISTIMPAEHAEDLQRILGRIRQGEKVEHFETRRIRKNGEVIDVSLTVSPIRDASGQIVGASKIGRDISEKKRNERERQDAERRKDEFLAMLAHELRNPLASISNAVHLFGRLESQDELEWAKDIVQRQVKHLTRLIDDLLDVSRITRGKISLRSEPLDLAPIVGSVVEVVRPLVDERKHQLTVLLPTERLRLMGDPVRLEQILVNLLTNAAKYSDAGSQIELTARREASQIVIQVRDTGIGIAAELLPHVFDIFVQGDRSMARSEGGLGIGLTLVKRLTELHGGEVSVASPGLGQGSVFTLRLPALDQASAGSRSRGDEEKRAAGQSSRILVVDDNIDTANGLAKLMKLFGHDVAVAYDGQSAMDAARIHHPEIVLLDVGLPRMNGYEVAAQMRREPCCMSALIIAISGYGQEEDRRKSQQAGFDHHLVKPVNLDALLKVIGAASPVR
jgi:PAS domain S-box-containing protein